MGLMDTWRAEIPASITSFIAVVSGAEKPSPAVIATAILWPLRELLKHDSAGALGALGGVVDDKADQILQIVEGWGEDWFVAVVQLASVIDADVSFQPAIAKLLALALHGVAPDPGTYTINGAIQAAMANIGGTAYVGQINVSSQTEEQRLATFLERAVARYQLSLQPSPRPREPYKFLEAYQIADRKIFFGRDTVMERLRDHILKAQLTVVHAPSGAGKSSLLRAGVGPELIELEYLPIFVRTGDDPLTNIINAIASQNEAARPSSLATLSLPQFVQRVVKYAQSTRGLVVVLDQFEELFMRLPSAHQAPVLDALAKAIEGCDTQLHVVIAIRKDYFSELGILSRSLPSVFNNQFRLDPMNEAEIRQAITDPLRVADRSVRYDDDLLEELISVLATDEMDLPELQILCTSLYDSAKALGTNRITLSQYEAAGRAKGILSTYLDDAILPLKGEATRKAAWSVLEVLVGSSGQRQKATRAELISRASVEENLIATVLDRLTAARLLRRDDDDDYELVHDYLARAINEGLSPAQQAAKRVREALRRSVDDWRTERLLIPLDRLHTFQEWRAALGELDDGAQVCLVLSAAWQGSSLDGWSDLASEAVIRHIAAMLDASQPAVPRYAARALGLLGRVEIIPLLFDTLAESGDVATKSEAARALRHLGARGVGALLAILAMSVEQPTWHTALAVLREEPDPQAVPALIRALNAETDAQRIIMLAQTILAHNDLSALRALLEALLRAPGMSVQRELVGAVKVLQDKARTSEEAHLRQLSAAYMRNIAILEEQVAGYRELFAPLHLVNQLEDNKSQLDTYSGRLFNLLGPRQILQMPEMQVMLVSVLGLKVAQEIV